KLWLSYQNYLENYYRLLKSKNEIEQKELQIATINIINQIKQGSYITINQNEELKNLLEKIYETNRRLIKHADTKTQIILEKELNDLQKSIHDINFNLKQKRETLATNKNRELTQHRTELQRIRQAITEISSELHPDDTRQLIQKLNLLGIQWTDAERSLTVLIDSLTKRRSEYQDFENKFLRFIQWFENFLNNEINQRLNGLTIQTSLEILKNDIRNIITDKRKYANELLIQARLLQSQLTDQIQIEIIKQKIEQLEHIMDTIEQHVEKRIKKTEITCKMFNEFEQGCENIRLWMDTIETNLQRTLPTQNTNEFHIHQQSIAAIEMDIEKHSTVMSSLLALGHNLLNDTDISSRTIDSLSRRIQTLEQRWLSLNELIKKNENS
ncbi:unnamed protein product, partial [Rotaria sordida]